MNLTNKAYATARNCNERENYERNESTKDKLFAVNEKIKREELLK